MSLIRQNANWRSSRWMPLCRPVRATPMSVYHDIGSSRCEHEKNKLRASISRNHMASVSAYELEARGDSPEHAT